jgi:hypothetical protein
MNIPSWLVMILWFIYGGLYFYRYFCHDRRKRYLQLGKGISRSIVGLMYFISSLQIFSTSSNHQITRLAILLFIGSDVFYMLQDIIMTRREHNEHSKYKP